MKTVTSWRLLIAFGTVAACLVASRGETQDPTYKPTFGVVDLKADFMPDPFKKELEAGGPIQTKNGGLTAWVAKEPDVTLNYTAGGLPLTFHAESKADTTLLILLPDGTWVADDDSGGMLDPMIKLAKPQTGRYQIWVGTISERPCQGYSFNH